MTYLVENVADSVIDLCWKRDTEVTNLKLQKLLYYVQAWNLAQSGTPIFQDEVEAWVHGPVVPAIFRKYKSFKWSPIRSDVEASRGHIGAELNAHIINVLNSYGKYSATQLERLTHIEDPWLDARKGLEPDEPSQNVIPKEAMRAYYSSRMNGR